MKQKSQDTGRTFLKEERMSSGVFCGECDVLVVGSGDKVAYRSHSSCIWCERVIFDREGSNVIFFFFFFA